MPYDEKLAARVRDVLAERSGVKAQKMFGDVGSCSAATCAAGSTGKSLIVRVSPEESDEAVRNPNVRLMDLTGKPMRGWLLVSSDGIRTEKALTRWVDRGARFAGSLPKKTKTMKKR